MKAESAGISKICRSTTLQIHAINHVDTSGLFLFDGYALIPGIVVIPIASIEANESVRFCPLCHRPWQS